jgi:translocation and assembly module TamB
MADAKVKSSKRRKLRQLIYGSLVVLFFVGSAWFLTSDIFRELIRHRLITQLQDATGGRVEIGRVEWNLARLRVGIDGLTIHGLEAPTDAPLVHVSRIDASLRIISLLGREISFKSLAFTSPAVNLIVYSDGRTNQPSPRVRWNGSRQSFLDHIFDIAVREFEVKNGLVQVNQQKLPLDFRAADVVADLHYQGNPEFYEGKVSVGKFDSSFKGYRPFSSTASVAFRLYHNALQVKSAQIGSEGSEISFEGKLTNFSKPSIAGDYRAKIDLKQVGAVCRVNDLQAGILELSGHGQYDAQQTSTTGKMQLTDGAWNDPVVHGSGAAGTAVYSLDQDRLQVSHIIANALGGTATGDFTVTHWNVSPHAPEEPRTVARNEHVIETREQSADAKFELHGLQIERIAALFSSQKLPFSDLHLSGVADGTAELTWAGAPKYSELRLDVRARANPNPVGQEIPVDGHVVGAFSFLTHTMQIGQAEVQTASSHLNATGSLSAKAVDLAVGVTTSRMQELEPLLLANGHQLPVQLAGEGSFQGTLDGRTSLPNIVGHLKLVDFSTVIRPATTTATAPELVKALHKKHKVVAPQVAPVEIPTTLKPVRFHWDSFDGFISYGPDAASVKGGVLRTGSARFEIAVNTALVEGKFTDTSVFHATSRIRDARVKDAEMLLGVTYPVTGTVNLEMQMSGTLRDPQGSGKLTIEDGTAYGQPLQSLSTDIAFAGREARFTNVHAASDAAKAEGSGSINVSSEQFHFDLQGSGIDLLRFPALQTPKVKLTGVADFTATGDGTLSAPAISGKARIRDISLGGKHEGDLIIDAATKGEDMELTAASQFVTATVTARGRIRLRGDFASDVTATFSKVDLQPFLAGIARGHSAIDGTFRVTGPLRHPDQLNARLEIPTYESEVEGVVLRNSGPIVATYKNGTAVLESFRLVGDATDLTSSGTIQLTDGHEMNLRADGRLNLKLVQSFNPEIVAYGQTSIGVQIGGTFSVPAMRGRITIEHAGISYVDLPNGLTDLNGTMLFNENRLQVEKLTAHTGGGDLAIGGFITYGRTIGFNLTATGKDIRIRYPEGVSANGDAELRLAGTVQNATLSGEIVINKFGLNPRFDFAYYLTRSKQATTTPNPDSPLNGLHFDVRVVSTPELQVQTSLAKITGDVDLRVRGTAFRPVVLGRISIVEGDITFNGTKYRLDRGDIVFTNPAKIEPVLDLEASARVSDYDISIGLHGTTDKLNTTYRSDPPLPTADVFALLAFGRTSDPSNTAPQSNSFTETASSAVLGSALNAAVGSRVQKLFGASRIKIDPEVGGAENNPNARITVEQQVSGNITLTYITNLAQSAQQVIQFQYNVNRNVSIVGVRDEYGVVGFEVQIRQRKR